MMRGRVEREGEVAAQATCCIVLWTVSCLRSRAEQPWEPARLVASRIKRLAMENRANAVISTLRPLIHSPTAVVLNPETGPSRPSTNVHQLAWSMAAWSQLFSHATRSNHPPLSLSHLA